MFRNFPKISVKEKQLKHCVFENCDCLSFENCDIHICEFFGMDIAEFKNCRVVGSVFDYICSCQGAPMRINDSMFSGCVFADITLSNGSFLCEGTGESFIEVCIFHEISTDREDKTLFDSKNGKEISLREASNSCLVDEKSCSGLDEIILRERFRRIL